MTTKAPLADFVIHDDEIGPTIVHPCGWYCLVVDLTLADAVNEAKTHAKHCHVRDIRSA